MHNRFTRSNHHRAHGFWACLCHVVFTGISAYYWKHTGNRYADEDDLEGRPAFPTATGLFIYLSLHGVLGILRFGHPQLSVNRGIRYLYDRSFSLLRVLPLILMTAQIYDFYWTNLESGNLPRFPSDSWANHLFTYNLSNLFILAPSLGLVVLNEIIGGSDLIKLLIIVVDVLLLAFIGCVSESYWTIFLGVQGILCTVGLELVSSHFEIGFLETFIVGMCFFNVFAYRSLGELIEVLQDGNRANHLSG